LLLHHVPEAAWRGGRFVPLYWRSTQSPDRIAVTLGTLEPSYEGPVDRELCVDTKPQWLPTAGN
jgi:hypothetical protein